MTCYRDSFSLLPLRFSIAITFKVGEYVVLAVTLQVCIGMELGSNMQEDIGYPV
jgi:hypothetical protein